MEPLRPIDPIRIICLDGKERQFLLSAGGFKRLVAYEQARNGSNGNALEANVDSLITALWEGLLNKDGTSKEDLAEVLPANIPALSDAVQRMIGVSEAPQNPTPASPPAVQ